MTATRPTRTCSISTRSLPNGDRQFVILPHTAHSIGYSNNRHLLWYAVRNFLQAPAAVGA